MDPRIKHLYWQLTALLLAAHFAGAAAAMPLTLLLTAWQTLHFLVRHRRWGAFEVQVRAGYLGLLLAGHLPGLWPIHLVQFVGVNAMLVAGYCPLARLLVLLPWNRRVPLTLGLLRWLLLSPPASGPITARVPGGSGAAAPAVRAGGRRAQTAARKAS